MSTTDTSAVDQAAHESAVAAARNEGAQAAAAAMQERIGAILSSDEANGRESLAKHFAFKTDMTVEAAVAALSEAPKAAETEAAPVNHLENAMDNSNQPNAGAGAGSGEGQSDANSAAADLALAKSFGLKGFTS